MELCEVLVYTFARPREMLLMKMLNQRRAALIAMSLVLGACDSSRSFEPERRLSKNSTSPDLALDTVSKLRGMQHPYRLRGRYIIRFAADTRDSESLTREILAKHGGQSFVVLRSLKGFWGALPDEAIANLVRDARIRYIEADVAIPTTDVGDTVQTGAPGPLDRMDQRNLPLNGSYEWSTDGTGVHLWIVDNGVDLNATELAGRVNTSYWSTYQGQDPFESCSTSAHGTDMAIAAAGSESGVARNATIHSARVNEPSNCSSLSSGAASSAME